MDRCNDSSDDNIVTPSLSRHRKCRRRVLEDGSSDNTNVSEPELVSTGKRNTWNVSSNGNATPTLCRRRRRRRVLEDNDSDDTGIPELVLASTRKRKGKVVKKRGKSMVVIHSSESEGDGSNNNTEVTVQVKKRWRQSKVIHSDGDVAKCMAGLENDMVPPDVLSSNDESEDRTVMSGPKTRLLRRTIYDRDFDSNSNKSDGTKLTGISKSLLFQSPRMQDKKSKTFLKDGGVRSEDGGDSGNSLDEFIAGEEDSEVEEELVWDKEERENTDDAIEEDGVCINYMALTFQLQQDEDRRISGDSQMLTFDKAFHQYLQFLCLALDPRLDGGQRGKTKGEKFMSIWPLDMHKPNLKHLAAAVSKVESDIKYRMTIYVQSGAWTAAFVKSIQSYPTMKVKHYYRANGYCCSACNRSENQQHWDCTLDGPFYDGASVWNSKRWDRYLPKDWDSIDSAIKCLQGETSETITLGSTCYSKACSYHALYHYKTHLVIRTQQHLRQPDGLLVPGEELTHKHKWVKKEKKLLAELLQEAKDHYMDRSWQNENKIWSEKAVADYLNSDSDSATTFQRQDASSCDKDSTSSPSCSQSE